MHKSTDPRPLSPHLWSWKWHATMASSIFHRLSGVANAAGLVFIACWLFALSGSPEQYAAFVGWASSWYMQLVLLVFLIGLVFHLVSGVRYLFWDAGRGFAPAFAEAVSLLNMAVALIGGGALWFILK